MSVSGHNLRFDPADPQIGLFLFSGDGSIQRSDVLFDFRNFQSRV